jgi:membrane-bound lytic murein transglycosylase D
MIHFIFRAILFCWLTSLSLGCAAPHLPFTTDRATYKEIHSPGASDAPAVASEIASPSDAQKPLLAGSSENARKTAIGSVEGGKQIRRKVENNPEEQATTLQEVSGPGANDELLDLWQKDIDKAMEQPAGHRKIQFSLPVVENQRVRYFVHVFCSKQRGFFERALARSGRYIPLMAAILREEGLPEDLVYLALIESGFSPYAYSRAKAMGPWQFIRSTGLRYGLKINSWVDERKDPVLSTRAAASYLKDLHQQFGEWLLAAAAYNAGEGKVGRAMQRSKANDFWRLTEKKRHLKLETRNYVPKFIAASIIASAPENHGFGDVAYEAPLLYDEVTIRSPLRLHTIAELANTSVSVIRELNPALLRNFTPPGSGGFTLRLPAGSGENFSRAHELLPDSTKVRLALHRVKKSETLPKITKRYGQTVKRLMEHNGLKTSRLRPGQELVIVLDGAV